MDSGVKDTAGHRPKLLFIVNVDWFFVSHRLPIARAARDAGYAVTIACGISTHAERLAAEGFEVRPLRIARGRAGLASTLRLARDTYRTIRGVRPDIVHLITIKPVLLGGIAARLLRVPKVVAAISGLGYTFIATGPISTLRRSLLSVLYRGALGNPRAHVIFQNEDDMRLVRGMAGLHDHQCMLVRGAGVDLQRFRPVSPPPPPVVVVMASRLLIDKGIREFAAAAALLKARGVQARFIVAGDRDADNPACVSVEELAQLMADGAVEFIGPQSDMAALFRSAHVAVLPSYREGMPLVLLEAAAAGLPVVTTDVPGCRSAIAPDTGILVPVRDASALAAALERLIRDDSRRLALGRGGRALAEREFGIDGVVAKHLVLYAAPAR